MEKDKVSLIVAIYRSEDFLKKLIESMINQTYKNLEIILVDDGSPDNSGKICDEYAKKDNRIKVIHKKNGGTCEARNYGLKASTGDYFSIIDGDDWLCEDYVEYLMNIINSTGAEMAMTHNIFTTRDQIQVPEDKIEILTPEDATIKLIYPGIEIGPWNKMYKKEIIEKYNISFNVPWSGEGLYFITTFAQHCTKVGMGQRKIYNYRLNNLNSGLTNLNVQMGINALWNIKNIKKNLIINSKKLNYACDWHIWKNYGFTLYLIVGTSIEDNRKLYKECIHNVRKMMFKTFIHSDVGIRGKLHILKFSIFPVQSVKKSLKIREEGLKKDKMK